MAGSLERQRLVGLGRQTARGTGVTADYWLQKTGFTANRQAEHMNDEAANGSNAETKGADVSRRWAEPSIPVYVDLNSWGFVEYSNSDSYAVAAVSGESVVYDHTMKVGITSITNKFMTLNADDPTVGDEDYVDFVINSLSNTFKTNERLSAEIGGVSQYPTGGTNTAALATPQYFYGRQVTVELAATVSAFSSSTFGATDVTFDRNNNVDTSETSAFQLGDIDIADHVIQSRSAELKVGKVLTNSTYIDYGKLATYRAARLTIVDTSVTLGNASNPTITITLPVVTVKSEPAGDSNARRTESLTITPHYGLDDAESASYLYKVVVRNTVADYSAV